MSFSCFVGSVILSCGENIQENVCVNYVRKCWYKIVLISKVENYMWYCHPVSREMKYAVNKYLL